MTFGVIEHEEPLLAELIALAFESAGHECLIFKDTYHAAVILQAIHLDSIVLDIQMPSRDGLHWLEHMAESHPDLPSRTLLLAQTAVTPELAARVRRLGAEVTVRPFSIIDVERVVMARLERARFAASGRNRRVTERTSSADLLN